MSTDIDGNGCICVEPALCRSRANRSWHRRSCSCAVCDWRSCICVGGSECSGLAAALNRAGCCPHSTCSDMQSLGCRSAMQAAAALRTELAAALNRPALTCSRSAPQHGERSWLLPVCCVRLAQLHLLSSKRCAGCCPHSTCSDMQSLAKLHLRRWQRMQRTASWLLPSFDQL